MAPRPACRWSSSTPPPSFRASCWPGSTSSTSIGRAMINPKLAPQAAGGADQRAVRPGAVGCWSPRSCRSRPDPVRCSARSCSALRRRRRRPAIGALGGLVLAAAYRALTSGPLKESVFLTARTTRDGLLAVRRLVDLLRGVRLSRRPGDDREFVLSLNLTPVHVPDPRAGHHLPARLAARMDRDHHHLRADLPAAAAALRTSIRSSSACWWRSTCRPRSCRRRWRWRRSTSRAWRRRTCS